MYARIIAGRVAETHEDKPVLAPRECAFIVEVGPEVQVGWDWNPECGCTGQTEEELLDATLLAIASKYEKKRSTLKADMLTAQIVDGPNLEANLAELRAKWNTLADSENEEIMSLFT